MNLRKRIHSNIEEGRDEEHKTEFVKPPDRAIESDVLHTYPHGRFDPLEFLLLSCWPEALEHGQDNDKNADEEDENGDCVHYDDDKKF